MDNFFRIAPPLSEADGRQLAIDMLRELEARWNDQEDLYGLPDEEVGEALLNREPEILRRYLAAVRKRRSPELERGFLCVVSDLIGSAMAGSPLDADGYERHQDGPLSK